MNKSTNQNEDIDSIVIERLKMGESMESIQFDLQSKGKNLNEIVRENNKNAITDKKIKKTISQLKDIGLDEKSIKKELNKLYGVTESEYQNLKKRKDKKERKNGKFFLIFGIILLTIGIPFLSMGISTGNIYFSQVFISSIGFLFTLAGILKIFKK